MKNDGVHDPVNRVCYMLEPRGDDAIVHVRLDPGGGLRPHGPPAIEERCSVDAATDGGRVFVPRNELMHRKEYR